MNDPGFTTADRSPRAVDGFELLEQLGEGGTAVVWRAHYLLTGEDVALKVWSRPLLDEHERRRFQNECRWHRELSGHPNVVGWIWASSPHDGVPWIATRLHGISLADLLRDQQAPPFPTAIQLSLDLLDGLAAMHRKGLIHRDVKPSNLLVLDGRGVLCDLGIAMPVDEVTREWRAGTPGFVAPELEDDTSALAPDRRSDVWAAAVTISRLIGEDAPQPVDHLVHAVAGSNNRLDRPADAREFATRLRIAAVEAGLQPAEEADRPELPDPRRRRSRLAMRGAAVALLAAGVGAAADRLVAGNLFSGVAQVTAAQAAIRVLPDISPGGKPLIRDHRNAGRCDGSLLPGGTQKQQVGGRSFAIVRIYYDERGMACAKLEKDPAGGLYNEKTYLALSLCNAEGQCDYDWNRYGIDAGPVKISSVSGCVAWRASALNPAETEWLLRDRAGSAGCS